MSDPIKVLIVEDSPTIAQILVKLVGTDPQLNLVGVANDGAQAIRYVARYRPNVITMDVNMPHMNGLEATEYVMAHHPTPILVLTASLAKQDVDLSFKMLSAGALEIIEKPSVVDWEREGRYLLERIKLLSRVQVITHIRGKNRYPNRLTSDDAITSTTPVVPNNLPAVTTLRPKPRRLDLDEVVTAPLDINKLPKPAVPKFTDSEILNLRKRKFEIMLVAASTGGPPALSKLLKLIPANFPIPILVVQHIPPGFSNGLADWLRGETSLTVKIPKDGEKALPGHAYLPDDDCHLVIRSDFRLYKDKSKPIYGLRPSADVTFESVAANLPGKALSILLTGMGRDGSIGMKALHAAHSYNIAQDEATSVIFGMPKSAIELGVVDKVLPLLEIPRMVNRIFLDLE